MPVMRRRAQRAALIASLSAWSLLALPLPTHNNTPTLPVAEPLAQTGATAAQESPRAMVR